ncbi:TPA_asm: hypothetical protein HUJ06_032042 [Nelumbo nucifera]|uniref:Glycosyltransferase n=2 Tax=Nelumbo nucifera TaxID=4432 RepID=A0A822ZKA0_NELNU|nr:PREDICTED: UDP-glycosyltransferase 90A1-like [Nelumbo nucifera]DAD45582.1 TPA_asm: hypothetical protein HUJ06_003812 [Nelumbo nucifera]DAD49321.1 TPA_asm: hypothetical protein HUJ06_032042 [Nelumbo nucifera]
MASLSQPHVVIFPFMAQGHTLPLLDLSKALSRRGIKVTIITTPSNALSILLHVKDHPNIHVMEIPFPPVEGLPKGCENTVDLPSMDLYTTFLMATVQLQQPFEQILREMSEVGSLPICVISDFFLGWTATACRPFGVPRLVFHGMGVLPMLICKTLYTNKTYLRSVASDSSSEALVLNLTGQNLPPLKLSQADLPDFTLGINNCNSFFRFLAEIEQQEWDSWGIIVNSFVELECEYVPSFESFYKDGTGAWCVGPLLLYDEVRNVNKTHIGDPADIYIKWLDEQTESESVIYVSFGTQANVSDAQLDEVAFGLEMSGHSFILVIRSNTWSAPDEVEDRVRGRGLILRDWVDQRRILAHRATGGFLSHCGWNSVLEGLTMGQPILAWPMIAEQSLNAKFVVEGLEAGILVPRESTSGEKTVAVRREVLTDGVKELMGGEKGRKARERAKELGRMAREAVKEGGSSHKNLSQLIESLSQLKMKQQTCVKIV